MKPQQRTETDYYIKENKKEKERNNSTQDTQKNEANSKRWHGFSLRYESL